MRRNKRRLNAGAGSPYLYLTRRDEEWPCPIESVGESNAVFLRGVGGDAATDPHKTGCSGYPEEEFSGTHKTAFKNLGLPCGSKPVGAAKTLSDVQ